MTEKNEKQQSVVDTLDVRAHDPTWRTFQKYRMKKFAGRKITLPTGVQIPASAFANVRPPGADDSYVLHSVEDYMKLPKPQCRYIWRIRQDEETLGLVESQQIRPVRMDEIKRTSKTARSCSDTKDHPLTERALSPTSAGNATASSRSVPTSRTSGTDSPRIKGAREDGQPRPGLR